VKHILGNARNGQVKVSMHVKILKKKWMCCMCGPQIWLCLFTFRPIALKQLNSLTIFDTFGWLVGSEATHPTGVQEVPSSISSRDFYVLFSVFVIVVFLLFLSKRHNYSRNVVNPFAMLIYLVYLTCCTFLTDHKGIKIQT